MNIDDSFNLRSGMFTTCSGYWDKDMKQYVLADSTEVAQCCAKNCVAPVKFCQKYCHDNKGPGKAYYNPKLLSRCLQTCNYQRESCLDTCQLSSPYVGPNNNYIQCANNVGCEGLKGQPDPLCVDKNKDEIFNCCRRSCTPRKDLDCQKHCEFLQNITLDPESIGIPLVKYQTLRELSGQFPEYPDYTWMWVMSGVILFLLLVGMLFLRR